MQINVFAQVRAAAVYALGRFIANTGDRSDQANQIDFGVAMTLTQLAQDGSALVRKVSYAVIVVVVVVVVVLSHSPLAQTFLANKTFELLTSFMRPIASKQFQHCASCLPLAVCMCSNTGVDTIFEAAHFQLI